jgi:hypothetical protein
VPVRLSISVLGTELVTFEWHQHEDDGLDSAGGDFGFGPKPADDEGYLEARQAHRDRGRRPR